MLEYFRQLSLFDDVVPEEPAKPEVPSNNPPSEKGGFSLQSPISYQLKRVRRKSVGIYVTANGVEVLAPRWVAQEEINAFVEKKREWILKKLEERRRMRRELGLEGVTFGEGGTIPFRGGRLTLHLGAAVTGLIPGPVSVLGIALPNNAESGRVRESLDAWLHAKAEQVIAERLQIVGARAGVMPTKWRLTGAHGQWGSCSPDGSMRFSWRLIYFDDAVIDYVIAHELAHRSEMNHSSAFWQRVEAICPDYVTQRSKLKGIVIGELPL